MNFRALDSNGDWTFGNGVQNYLVEADAINVDIATALKTFLNECFFALNFGVDWWNLIGSKNQQGIILQCRTMIVSRYGVVKINEVQVILDRVTRKLSISYNVDTIYSRGVSNTVTVP